MHICGHEPPSVQATTVQSLHVDLHPDSYLQYHGHNPDIYLYTKPSNSQAASELCCACMHAAPSGGAIWFGGDDAANSNAISLSGCTVSANNAQYGGALYGAAGGRMLVRMPMYRFVYSSVVSSSSVYPGQCDAERGPAIFKGMQEVGEGSVTMMISVKDMFAAGAD